MHNLVFLRGEGLVGIFLEKHHYPFDLQVGPLLGTQGGVGPISTNPRSYLIHLFGVRFLLWTGRIPIKYQNSCAEAVPSTLLSEVVWLE